MAEAGNLQATHAQAFTTIINDSFAEFRPTMRPVKSAAIARKPLIHNATREDASLQYDSDFILYYVISWRPLAWSP